MPTFAEERTNSMGWITDRWSRGWSMARGSWSVLKRHPKLALFPAVSGVALFLALGLMTVSLIAGTGFLYALTGWNFDDFGSDWRSGVVMFIGAFLVLYVLTAIAVFFNTALVYCTLEAYSGKDPSIRSGLHGAVRCLPQILGWALVAASVGMLLNAIEGFLSDKLGIVGEIIASLFNAGWAAATYLVLPVLAVERTGPVTAIRRSSAILRSKWGESIAGDIRISLIGVVFVLQALLVFFIGFALEGAYAGSAVGFIGIFLMAVGVLYGVASIIVLLALSAMFKTAVYLYATTGQVPSGLDPSLVAGAFRAKA
jgi:hypothetical protein